MEPLTASLFGSSKCIEFTDFFTRVVHTAPTNVLCYRYPRSVFALQKSTYHASLHDLQG